MEEERSLTWGVQVTPKTKEQINRILNRIGGKNKKESFKKMLNIVEFQVTRKERNPELCEKVLELNSKMSDLRDTVQDILELQEEEIHGTKKRFQEIKLEKENLEEKIKILEHEKQDLEKELVYLKEIHRLSKSSTANAKEKRKIVSQNKEKNDSKVLGQISIFDEK